MEGDVELKDAWRTLNVATQTLADECARDEHLTKPLLSLLGALYSVRMAQRLGFPNRKKDRSDSDPSDLATLVTELTSENKLRETGRWVQGYWVNNATHRIASSFERVCKAIGFAECPCAESEHRYWAAEEYFKKTRNQMLQEGSSLATVWRAANVQKHEFGAPAHRKVAEVNEFIVVNALLTLLKLACDNSVAVSKAYKEWVHVKP